MPPRPGLLPELLRRGPFLASDAYALGVTRAQLRTRGVRRLYRGVYAARELPDTPTLRAAGALLLLPPGSVLSHRTAAELRHLPLPETKEELVHALVPGRAGQRIEASAPTVRVRRSSRRRCAACP